MCGLVGLILKTENGAMNMDLSMFKEMLYIDALRGWDSTGVASFHNNGELRALKEASQAASFIDAKEFEDWGKDFIKNGKAALGHNRKATVGTIVDETAHPFMITDGKDKDQARYAFMHNGTLRNHEKLYKTKVDSEALAFHLTKCEGNPEALQEALAEVDGAYACMWIDQQKEHLYLLRNHERPLYLAQTSIGYIVASEWGFITTVAARNNTKVEECKLIETDTLYTFDLSNYKVEMTEDKLTIKKSKPPLFLTHTKGGGTTQSTSNAGAGDGKISKQAYKKLRKDYIGSAMGFWMEDYTARHPNNDGKNEWLVWGFNEDIEFQHQFRGYITEISEADLLETFENVPVVGKISDLLYLDGEVIFMLDEVVQARSSNIKRPVVVH